MSRKAAFFRVEGALTRPSPLPSATFYVLNQREVQHRFTRLGGVLASAGLSLFAPLGERQEASRLAWASLRGMSADRLEVLSEELCERQLIPSLRPQTRELMAQCRKEGFLIVLLSEQLELAIAPLAQLLQADLVVANTMELHEGQATGRLLEPVVAQLSGQWTKAFAASHDIDLSASRVYGSSGGDALLMSAVGEPCAVSPDWRLRTIARDQAWPIVEDVA